MQYKGKELIELTSEQWDGKTREMLVWSDYDANPTLALVCGFTLKGHPIADTGNYKKENAWKNYVVFQYCAEIPKEEEPKEYSLEECIEAINGVLENVSKINELTIGQIRNTARFLEELKSLRESSQKLLDDYNQAEETSRIMNNYENEVIGMYIAEIKDLKEQVKQYKGTEEELGGYKSYREMAETLKKALHKQMTEISTKNFNEAIEPKEPKYEIGKKYIGYFKEDGVEYTANLTCVEPDKFGTRFIDENNTYHRPELFERIETYEESEKPKYEVGKKYKCYRNGTCNILTCHGFQNNENQNFFTENSKSFTDKEWWYREEDFEKFEPYEPKYRRMTNRELAKWLAQGNGEFTRFKVTDDGTRHIDNCCSFRTDGIWPTKITENNECDWNIWIRAWSETEWHEPLIEE